MRNRLEKNVKASQLAAELGLPWEGEDVAIAVVTPLSAKSDDEAPYFSMILVPGEGRRL